MKKFTLEETKYCFKQVGLRLVDENEAKGVTYKYKCMDENGYLYSRSLDVVRTYIKKDKSDYSHIFSTRNPYFYFNMKRYIENNVGNGTILLTNESDISCIDQKLKFKCGECGREFASTWHTFVHKKEKCCSKCFERKLANKEINGAHKDSDIFHKAAAKNGLIVLDGPQIRRNGKTTVQDKQGYRGIICASRLLSGSSFERYSVRNPYTIDNLRIYAFLNNWDCTIYNQEYKGDKYKIKMRCSCGNDFEVTCVHFLEGKFQCNECRAKQSNIAKTIQGYLENKQINFVKEKTFVNCKNKRNLPFDFYLVDYNACIEVDGIGHYRPVNFGGNKDKANANYQQRVINDKIKDDYCKQNNIPLLRLPFWIIEQNKYEEPINNFIFSIESNDFNK